MWNTCFSGLLTTIQRTRGGGGGEVAAVAAAEAVMMTLIMIKKGKFIPAHTLKAYNGNRGTNPLILNLGTRWR